MANGFKKKDEVWFQTVYTSTTNDPAVVVKKNDDGTYDLAVVTAGTLVIKENVTANEIVARQSTTPVT